MRNYNDNTSLCFSGKPDFAIDPSRQGVVARSPMAGLILRNNRRPKVTVRRANSSSYEMVL